MLKLVPADSKPNQVVNAHENHLTGSGKPCQHDKPVVIPESGVFLRVESLLYGHFRQQRQANAPRPQQQVQVQVVPNRHKSEHHPNVVFLLFRTSQRHKDVPDKPLVESTVPASPKAFEAVVVVNAPPHVLRSVESVEQGPRPGQTPNAQELQPQEHQVEDAEVVFVVNRQFIQQMQVLLHLADCVDVAENYEEVEHEQVAQVPN